MAKFHCDICEKPIKTWEHYFKIESNHPESSVSYDTVTKYFHIECLKNTLLIKFFDWHIKGEY